MADELLEANQIAEPPWCGWCGGTCRCEQWEEVEREFGPPSTELAEILAEAISQAVSDA